jgi:hypothetical protein
MRPERASSLVARWVRLYTRRLPAHIAERRVEEIDADLHEHVVFERARGAPERAIALGIVSRMARGMAADVAWRRHVQPLEGDPMRQLVALLLAAIGIAVLALVLDSPILVLVSVAAIGIVTLGAFVTSVQTAQRANFVIPFVATLAGALAVAALGVTAIIVGDRGDAPGLVLFGVALVTSVVVGALAFGMRTAQRSSR